jgi:hypothetical protein
MVAALKRGLFTPACDPTRAVLDDEPLRAEVAAAGAREGAIFHQ